jgi:hypothetical protein
MRGMAATAIRCSIVVRGGFFHCPSHPPTGSCLSHLAPWALCLSQVLTSTTQKPEPNLESKGDSVLIASLKRGVEVFRSYKDFHRISMLLAILASHAAVETLVVHQLANLTINLSPTGILGIICFRSCLFASMTSSTYPALLC